MHKFQLLKAKHNIVFSVFLWYYLTIKGKETHQTRKGNKMEFWSMEAMEIMGDAMEEVAEWLAHEADMETHPFD